MTTRLDWLEMVRLVVAINHGQCEHRSSNIQAILTLFLWPPFAFGIVALGYIALGIAVQGILLLRVVGQGSFLLGPMCGSTSRDCVSTSTEAIAKRITYPSPCFFFHVFVCTASSSHFIRFVGFKALVVEKMLVHILS